MAKMTFLGAAGTVTGSKHLLEWDAGKIKRRILVDCGMFQGLKELRLKNWDPLGINPELIDAVILTHAHIDHMGYLPKLVKDGFDGTIYATAATCDLAEIMLRDAAHIQEEDAKHAKKYGYSKHKNPEPLYTTADAEKVFPLMQPLSYDKPFPVLDSATVFLRHSGHILGSAFVELTIVEDEKPIKVVYSGDVGRYDQPILLDPDPPVSADYLLLESTYGGRKHEGGDPKKELGEAISRTIQRGGSVVIPAFALGRSQVMLTYLAEMLDEHTIPPIDVYLDSPMAISTTWETRSHREELDAKMLSGIRENRIFRRSDFHYLTTRDQSMKLNTHEDPCVIISASGMATAGRVLHHLKRLLPGENNSVIFVGYQAVGTRGRVMVEGATEIKIHGSMIPVKAEIVNISDMSGHADYSEMMPWLSKMSLTGTTFLVHGEEEGLNAMSERLSKELGWNTYIPALGEEVELGVLSEKPVVEEEVVTEEQLSLKGAVAVVMGSQYWDSVLTQMPGTVVFREETSDQLAERIVRSGLFREVLVMMNNGTDENLEKHESFIKLLEEGGVVAWTVKRENR